MDDNKNKKINEALPDEKQTNEELPDDALENVAGGGLRIGSRTYLNKKTDEELPDDALEDVAGGGFKDWVVGLFDQPGGQGSGQ